VLKTALARRDADPRHLRVLVMDWIMSIPFISPFMRRTGQTVACADDAIELLRRGELVCTFPEGANGTGKLFGERYRLRRFGRGGFVRTALRTGAPIVPVAIVGAEEIYPMFHDFRPMARVLGSPYFPITPTWPWLGPLGLVPLPTKWLVEFCEPIPVDAYRPEDADDAALVLRLSDEVRGVIQAKVDELRARRTGVFAR
jgi:1-acyl-sn-glycerol-3-phosphate acyltransferase